MILLLLLTGCLERVTGAEVPLDPRFYAAVEAAQGDPGQGAGGIPFASYDGETVTVRGTIVAEDTELSIDLGVRLPKPDAPGGVVNEGKILLDGAGAFEIVVPINIGRMELEALQDRDQDGPTDGDPHASIWIEVGDRDVEGIELVTEPGVFGGGGGPDHVEAAPGAPGGDPNAPGAPGDQGAPPPGGGQGAPPGAGDMPPFGNIEGPTVTVSGTLRCEGCELVDLDLFQPDADAPGGRKMLGKLKRAPGRYTLEVPRDFGPLLLEAFSDPGGDGPGAGDPMGRYMDNPLQVGAQDLSGIDVVLEVTEDGRMPGDRPAPPPQQQRPPPER